MQRFRKSVTLALMGALLLAGCAKPAATTEKEPPSQGGSPAQVEPQGAPGGIHSAPVKPGAAAATLFPAEDREYTYFLTEKEDHSEVTEHLLREGDRLVGVQGEKVYLTWHLNDQGVWRNDPKNPAVLLRYLPPTLTESAWQQTSGDAQILFRLMSDKEGCYPRQGEGHLACWQLTMVNRGEQLTLWFLEGMGPVRAENQGWARSADYFDKGRNEVRPSELDATRRQQWLAGADKAPGDLPAVVELNPQEFTRLANRHHWDVQPQATVSRYDVDGDGTQELVRGTLGGWTTEPVSFYREDYTPLGKWDPQAGKQKVTPVTFDGYKASFFLLEMDQGHGPHVTMLGYYNGENQPRRMVVGWGWDHKASSTPATKVTVDPKGQITVVWEMVDPAQHTRTRVYDFTGFQTNAGFGIGAVELLSSTIGPTQGQLVYPSEPADVLRAAFNAYWLEQSDELGRYFASPQAAAHFVQVQQLGKPQYGLGRVKTGKLIQSKESWSGGLAIDPAPVGADNSVEFMATASGYEWSAAEWGRATFTKDGEGRWVLQQVDVSGSHFAGP